MKMLFSSPDLAELGRLVKRLVWARIPCAVCKEPVNSQLSIWIQRDIDFPLALRVFTHRDAPYRLPHWARALDSDLPAPHRIKAADGLLAQAKEPTWTGTARAAALRHAARQTRPGIPGFLQVIQASAKEHVKLAPQEDKGSRRSKAHYEEIAIGR